MGGFPATCKACVVLRSQWHWQHVFLPTPLVKSNPKAPETVVTIEGRDVTILTALVLVEMLPSEVTNFFLGHVLNRDCNN